MRYALRNQHKIKSHFGQQGDDVLVAILRSLDEAPLDEVRQERSPGDPYPRISVRNASNGSQRIDFYVVSVMYDVMTLAFVGFFKLNSNENH